MAARSRTPPLFSPTPLQVQSTILLLCCWLTRLHSATPPCACAVCGRAFVRLSSRLLLVLLAWIPEKNTFLSFCFFFRTRDQPLWLPPVNFRRAEGERGLFKRKH
jgi:hypothetical protein